ncbi:MAG: M14 family metallopeptidase [Cyclobacteriaceae bacterium]
MLSVINDLGLVNNDDKYSGFIAVEGTPVSMPVTVIKGSQPGPNILITGGVHGGEYPCIETAIQLAKEIDPQNLHGNVVVIHPVNTSAFLARMQYFGPYDGKNLNRVFPGKAKGTVSDRIAYTVNQIQIAADFYIDLHGGDIHESLVPFVIYSKNGGQALAEESRMASSFVGFPYVVGSVSEGGSISGAAQSGTPGFLAELGQCGRWSPEEVEEYKEGIYNVLKHLGSISGEPKQHDNVAHLQKMAVLKAENEGCWYPSVVLNQTVTKGDKMGEIRDFFGNTLSQYTAEESGVVLYLVTSLAITKDDPLAAIGVS